MKNSNLFLLINTLSGMGYSLAAPLFPSLGNSEILTEEILGWIIGTYSLAGTLLTPFIPYLTNRFNRVNLLIISTFLEATCTLLYGFLNYVGNFYVLLVIIFILRTIHGLSSAIIGVLVYSLTISLTDESELELSLGSLEIGWSIGTSSGPLFYSLPFIILGLVLFISVYLSKSIHSDKLLENDDSEQNPSFVRFLKYPKVFLILIGFIIVMILSSFYFPCLVNHLKENYSLTTSSSSLFFVIPIASYVFILQFLDDLTNKFGHYSIYSFGLIVSTISPIFLNPCPPFDTNIDELIANDISSAINTLTIYIGEFIGPIIGGYLTSKYDFKYCCYFMFLIGCGFSAIFILSFIVNIKNEIQLFINSKGNEVQTFLNESSFREGLIDSQIMSKSLQISRENKWNFKFEVLSSRRNYTVKKRGIQKNNSMILLSN